MWLRRAFSTYTRTMLRALLASRLSKCMNYPSSLEV